MSDTTVIVEQPSVVVVGDGQSSSAVVENKDFVVVSVGEQGPPGPPGLNGDGNLAGHPVLVTDLSAGDMLRYSGAAWTNVPQTDVVDGGNF